MKKGIKIKRRNKRILELRQKGLTYRELAKLFDLNIKTVYELIDYRVNKKKK